MCYYCRYLAHEKLISYDDEQYLSNHVKYHHVRSCYLTTVLRLIGITLFFVMLNITIVLSQSSQVQQQKDQSSQGKKQRFVSIFILRVSQFTPTERNVRETVQQKTTQSYINNRLKLIKNT